MSQSKKAMVFKVGHKTGFSINLNSNPVRNGVRGNARISNAGSTFIVLCRIAAEYTKGKGSM